MNTTPAGRVAAFLVEHRGKMSQHDLAQAIGVSDGMVAHYEKGRRPVGDKQAAAIARVLHLSAPAIADFTVRRLDAELDEMDRRRALVALARDAAAAHLAALTRAGGTSSASSAAERARRGLRRTESLEGQPDVPASRPGRAARPPTPPVR